ncbi:tetratricopeptide repeat protein [Trichocoleus sp. DQ-A3]|uniref:CHAT domain-containing protein n=1 Tax=Cyanophyceae TaxID=3028117 RepID=UPI0016822543|nr:tetratricopeptide repeat protein [Coleofasciculus sp. FACHB-125]MBD1902072.1 tetratricopeptide repeat protein [Coleofasciculus sp. FACHB-125]
MASHPGTPETLFQVQTTQQHKTNAERLFQEGTEQLDNGQLQEALKTFVRVLELRRNVGERAEEGETLHKIGVVYHRLSQYQEALKFYLQALVIRREVGDTRGEAITLHNLGEVYRLSGQYQQALETLQQALTIRREVGDKAGVGSTLNHIAAVYYNLGEYYRALEFYEQALTIRREVSDKAGEGRSLNGMALVYDNLGYYSRALQFYQQALAIFQLLGNPIDKARLLDNIGSTYFALGEYSQALNFYQQALDIYRKIGNKESIGTSLHNVGLAYDLLGQYSQALAFYQQALAISKEVSDLTAVANILNNLGLLYQQLGKYSQAIDVLEQALLTFQELGNRADVGETLDSLGTVYQSLGQYSQALDLYQQALAIRKDVGERPGERLTLSNIGDVLAKQNQPELAIVFYKQSVNVTEAIRNDLRSLPVAQQQSYTATIADTYRRLADLLLQQDRVLEAQQVLDLLKVQEIDDYLRNVRGNEQTAQGIPLTSQEQRIRDSYNNDILNREIQLGRELAKLQNIPRSNRTPEQQQQLEKLTLIQQEIKRKFIEFINSPEVVAFVQQLSAVARESLKLEQLDTLNIDILQHLEPKAVLLYPLILEDRLELVLTAPDARPIHRTVTVKKKDLNQAIVEFRDALEKPDLDATVPALKLYNWLIKPIEKDLAQAEAKSIIYAPDGQLRYVPLAALYDGKQWLVQRFRINNITAMSLTKFTTQHLSQPQILAGAFATGRHNFTLRSTRYGFSGLKFAGVEVENLAAMMPGTTKLLDREFSREATIPRLNDYTIVHLATHAMFVAGEPEDSFILLGDGKLITLRDIQVWTLPNVDLVVLSACETATSGKSGNGEEILGFGYQMQKTGAKAAIASLWKVDDGGTQVLMSAFYAALQPGKITRAEALQRAQVALITGDDSALGQTQGKAVQQRARSNLPPEVANRLSHPHYWAPFILIGNGL